MAKIIVTHISPDFDGIPAIWLLKKFHPDFTNAQVAFVPAGKTYQNQPVDSDPDIFHVDTGMGKFDHHQTNAFTCGAKLVFEWLVKEGYVKDDDEALARLIEIVTQIDHGWDTYKWVEAANDRYEFSLHSVLFGWKFQYPGQYEKQIELTINALEAVYKLLQLKVAAEKVLKLGLKFKTKWGVGIGLYTGNEVVMDLAIKEGYAMVVRKDPVKGFVRITGSAKHKVDLTGAFETLRQKDPQASWFLHASKVLIRNGSSRNPTMKPTKLEIDEVVKILGRTDMLKFKSK